MNRKLFSPTWIVSLLLLCSCQQNPNQFECTVDQKHLDICLEKVTDSLYILHLNNDIPFHSIWKLAYPVYHFDHGDLTGNGIPEIVVGVIKPTRFDPKPDKRLFIYRISEGNYIRPLWLGSRVSQPLEDFRIIREQTPAQVRTMERERSGKFLIAEYAWRGFGLEFKRYLKREIDTQEARDLLES